MRAENTLCRHFCVCSFENALRQLKSNLFNNNTILFIAVFLSDIN